MSISRENWSALSSLARQWTREDEEEVEREKRRRVKSSSSSADPDADFSQTPRDTPTSDSAFGRDSTSEMSPGLSRPDAAQCKHHLQRTWSRNSQKDRDWRTFHQRNLTRHRTDSLEQMQQDFVEMLRVRDEKRRMRHVETLRRQKEVGEHEAEACGGGGGARVEVLGDLDEEQGRAPPSVKAPSKPQPAPKTASYRPDDSSSSCSTKITNGQHENGASSCKDPDAKPSSNPARKFVSSVSISLDKSPSGSGSTPPMSPRSPAAPLSPREHWPSPCQSPSARGARSPVQNGHVQETSVYGSSSNGNFEQTSKPAFVRQSCRTISFRMMRKKEEESAPLQRSASVRMASKKFEFNTDQNENEDQASSFQRNSKQRISSRSIQEKMERLAQAAQKSEVMRSPDVTQRTLFLLDEVSRKRGLFEKEKEQQAASPTSPGVSRQEFRSFTSGMSDRINRWLNKTNQTGSSHSPTDLRNVDITSKRSLFETREADSATKTRPGKISK